MKMSIVLFLLFAVVLFPQNNQSRIRFIDSETWLPVQGVNVILNGNVIPNHSDKDGYIVFPTLTPGDILVCSHISYDSFRTNIPQKSKEGDLVIILTPALLTLQSILVEGYLNNSSTSNVAAQTITGKEIEKRRMNEDFPQLLQNIPSVTYYSEGGDGTGYNYLNIRGFDQRRILISVNGIPQNDPEDHNVYWIDFNDLAASSDYIQVQKGAGFALTGYPAIGGAINIITKASAPRGVKAGLTLGSNNLRKYELNFSSGLTDADFSVSGRAAKTLGSGYRDYSWVSLGSYYLSILKKYGGLLTQFNMYGGGVEDGLVYTGLPKFAVTNEKYRKLNYSYWEQKNGEFSYSTQRRPEEKERFNQPHFEILNEYIFPSGIKFNSAAFFVLGQGYFDYDGSWAPFSYYRLTQQNGYTVTGNPDETYSNNAVIRAQVENRQFGFVPRFEIENRFGSLVIGGEFRFHKSVHWGSLLSGSNLPPELTSEYRYYYYEGGKDMLSGYIHQKFTTLQSVNFFAEAQLTYQKYRFSKEKYIGTEFSVPHLFFNPRIGMNYSFSDEGTVYFSLASVAREPRLKNYYDAAEATGGELPQFSQNSAGIYNFDDPKVKPERLFSLDAGYQYQDRTNTEFSVNLYYMAFRNEIVKQGQLDRFGVPTTGNMPYTRHIGIELFLKQKFSSLFGITASASISSNKITEGTYFAKTKNKGIVPIDLSGNRLAGFPAMLMHITPELRTDFGAIYLDFRYNGKFYSDNFDSKLQELNSLYTGLTKYPDNVNDAFFVTDLQFVSGEATNELIRGELKFRVNNIFNKFYSQYAVGEEFFPAAGTTYLFSYYFKF